MIDADTGTVAHREYDCHMPDGTVAIVAVSLGSMGQSSTAATFAHESGALARGHITVRGVGIGLSHPILWMHTPSGLKVVADEDGPKVSDELHSLLLRALRVFFRDVRHVAPGLGEP
jgi:hypothetical protein